MNKRRRAFSDGSVRGGDSPGPGRAHGVGTAGHADRRRPTTGQSVK